MKVAVLCYSKKKKNPLVFPLKKKMKNPKDQLERFKRGLFIKPLMALVSGLGDKAYGSVVISCQAPVVWIYDTVRDFSLPLVRLRDSFLVHHRFRSLF